MPNYKLSIILFLLTLFFLGFNACRNAKDGMTRRERKAWQLARKQFVQDSLIKDSLRIVAREHARLDSIRVADSIAALPPPINYDTVFVASILRTPCYGKCPHYEVRLYASGYATYEGKAYSPRFGRHEARLDSAKIHQLLNKKIEAINYFSLASQYPMYSRGIVDFPLTVTSVRLNNRKKIIYNRNDAPPKLVSYEKFFDQLFKDVDWQPIKKK